MLIALVLVSVTFFIDDCEHKTTMLYAAIVFLGIETLVKDNDNQ